MKYEVTKVTYNMYSCDTCCVSREMMGLDDVDSAKWQKSKALGQMSFWEFLS